MSARAGASVTAAMAHRNSVGGVNVAHRVNRCNPAEGEGIRHDFGDHVDGLHHLAAFRNRDDRRVLVHVLRRHQPFIGAKRDGCPRCLTHRRCQCFMSGFGPAAKAPHRRESRIGLFAASDLPLIPTSLSATGGDGMERSVYLAIQRRSIHFFSHHQARDLLAWVPRMPMARPSAVPRMARARVCGRQGRRDLPVAYLLMFRARIGPARTA